MQHEKAERITITLPPNMLASIKQRVSFGSYGPTSELIREAMRLMANKRRRVRCQNFPAPEQAGTINKER